MVMSIWQLRKHMHTQSISIALCELHVAEKVMLVINVLTIIV